MYMRISWMMLLAVMLAVAGCDGSGRERPPQVRVNVIHAAPGHASLQFLRVERLEVDVNYRGQSSISFDEDTYTFNIERIAPGTGMAERLMSFQRPVLHGMDYSFVLTEFGGELEVITVERPAHPANATAASVMAMHAGPDVPPLSMYVVPQDTDVSTTNPLATLGFPERSEPVALPAGTYELVLTTPGNPGDVQLRTGTFELSNSDSNMFVIFSEAGQGISEIGVLRGGTQSQYLSDRDMQAAVRVFNAVADLAPRDLYIGEVVEPPAIAGAEYGVLSELVTAPAGNIQYTITPQGNVGALELETAGSTIVGRIHTIVLSGDPGAVEGTLALEDRRRIYDQGRVRIANATNGFDESLQIFLVPEGTPVEALLFPITLSSPGVGSVAGFVPGDYEMYVRISGETEGFAAGPLPYTIEGGELYNFYLVDSPTSSDVEVLLVN